VLVGLKVTRNGHWLRAEAALQLSFPDFTGELIFYLGRTRMSGAESCAMRMLQVLAVVLVTIPTLLMALAIPGTAQSPDRVYRLAHIALTEGSEQITREHMLPELAREGFVEGRNLEISVRVGSASSLPTLARELVAEKPDAIIAIGAMAAGAAKDATDSVPIVLFASDPVELGLAKSFSRPTGMLPASPPCSLSLRQSAWSFCSRRLR